MTDKLKVVATRDGKSGKPEELGEIRRGQFARMGPNRIVLGLAEGTDLMALIQIDGHAGRPFHLVDEEHGVLYNSCRIVGDGGPGHMVQIEFDRQQPWP